MNLEDACIGCLLGTAVGDALGLPFEGIAPERAARMYPRRDTFHLVAGRGMVSDDTEHACMTAQAVLRAPSDSAAFQRALARSLRWWLAGLPAGVGLATLRSILKLWVGMPPTTSGVFSAGNGPAMRSPILGVLFGDTPDRLVEYVRRSTEITHSDPKAFHGALAVAVAAHHSATQPSISGESFFNTLRAVCDEAEAQELLRLLEGALVSAKRNESTLDYARSIGSSRGVTGYMLHTVPCVVQTWLRYPDDLSGGLQEIIAAGGDTDTTAAILGAIIGARTGKDGIPPEWLTKLCEWPRGIGWIEALGRRVARTRAGETGLTPPSYFVPGVFCRNLLFMVIVLAHGFRRLLPPF